MPSSLLIALLKERDYESAARLIMASTGSLTGSDDNNDVDNNDPIFYALDSVDVTRLILAHAPDMAWSQNKNGDRPLHIAHKIEIVDLLLKCFPEGASTKNKDGKLPLHFAASTGPLACDKIISALLHVFNRGASEQEARNYSLPLHYACAFKAPVSVVELLLNAYPLGTKESDKTGSLPLHLCIIYNASYEVVEKVLISNPQAVRARDGKQRLALHACCKFKASAQITTLIYRAYPQAINEEIETGTKKTPLYLAIRHGADADIVEMLLKAHAASDPSFSPSSSIQQVEKRNGETILHTALECSASRATVEMIIKHLPQSVFGLNDDQKLPIHYAAWHQTHHDVIQLLIDKFPEGLAMQDSRFENLPLHFAVQYTRGKDADMRPVMCILTAYPAAVFVANKHGHWPIHLAARNQCPLALLDALLKICPHSLGQEDRSQLLPVDHALRFRASSEVISRLLGVPDEAETAAAEAAQRQKAREDEAAAEKAAKQRSGQPRMPKYAATEVIPEIGL